jgi:hypothetical protein
VARRGLGAEFDQKLDHQARVRVDCLDNQRAKREGARVILGHGFLARAARDER